MQYEITHGPSYAIVDLFMDPGDRIASKTGAMVSRTDAVSVDTSVGGNEGVGGMIKRAVSSSKSFVENVFEATGEGANLTLAPDHPGDVIALDVGQLGQVMVQSGSIIANEEGVDKSSTMNNASNFFSSGDLRVLTLSGHGLAFLSAYGAVYEKEVYPNDPVIVDEDHLIAWTGGLNVSREKDGSIKSSLLGGEGMVTRFTGDGSVWLQTRDPTIFRQNADEGT